MPRPERVFKTDAIILRRHEFGEADRILTLLTPEHGKIRAIAKGARRIKSKLNGHVELFSRVALLIARGRELHVVSQAEQVEAYLALRDDLLRGAYAHYLVELLDRFSEDEEASQPLYGLLDAALHWLCAPQSDLALVTRFFELRLLRLTGFEPSLFECAAGNEALEPRDQFFSVVEGGVVCPIHAKGRAVIPLSLNCLKLLRYMVRQDYAAVARLKMSPALHYELERILGHYLAHLLEVRLKSADFLHQLRARFT